MARLGTARVGEDHTARMTTSRRGKVGEVGYGPDWQGGALAGQGEARRAKDGGVVRRHNGAGIRRDRKGSEGIGEAAARWGMVRSGKAGMALQRATSSRTGSAWLGEACVGLARRGWRCSAPPVLGMERQSWVRHCSAGCGVAWQGEDGGVSATISGAALGRARLGRVRDGKAGMALYALPKRG